MKSTTRILAPLLGLALIGSAPAASTVSYSYYTTTSSTDTSWVTVAGYDSILAGNVGGSTTTTVGSVSWLAMPSGNVQATANGVTAKYAAGVTWAAIYTNTFYSGGPSLLNDGASTPLQASGVDYTIGLSGLTTGENYKIQFVLADNRADSGYETILAKGPNVTGDSTAFNYSHTDGRYGVITASFTADATTASFQPGQKWGGTTPNGTFLSGIQVLAVPEPSAALLGGLGLLGLLRRRR